MSKPIALTDTALTLAQAAIAQAHTGQVPGDAVGNFSIGKDVQAERYKSAAALATVSIAESLNRIAIALERLTDDEGA